MQRNNMENIWWSKYHFIGLILACIIVFISLENFCQSDLYACYDRLGYSLWIGTLLILLITYLVTVLITFIVAKYKNK